MSARQRAIELFESHFGVPPEGLVRSPGRVNLIGDHTDYNDGWAMPMAIDRATWFAYGPGDDGRVTAVSHDEPGVVTFPLGDDRHVGGWGDYVQGVVRALGDAGPSLGWRAAIATDLPVGAGLSSSAALELGVARVVAAVGGTEWDPRRAALAGRAAENEWVGAKTGLMDQLSVAHAVAGHALLMDCRSLELALVPLPDAVEVVVLDTGVRRELVTSAYADRRSQCEAIAAALEISSLRDATLADLEGGALGDELYRRGRHVVTENQRVLDFADALRNADLVKAGALMVESHTSLRDDYEVTGDALDAMFHAAQTAPGGLGARMTGGGFAGAVVALVDASATESFIALALQAYGTGSSGFATRASAGVSLEGTAIAR